MVIALSRATSIDVRAKVVYALNYFLDVSDNLLTKRHCTKKGARDKRGAPLNTVEEVGWLKQDEEIEGIWKALRWRG